MKIVFAGEGDQQPGIEPGDVIFVLDEQEDAVFKRRGSDLYMHMVGRAVCVYACVCAGAVYYTSVVAFVGH